MREQGRCAGCQESGELRKMRYHVLACLRWAKLYRDDPAAALSPEKEHARWHEQERPAERAGDLALRVSDTQVRRAASVARFKVADPLED